jgi:oligosaccharide repeat unit polymerase
VLLVYLVQGDRSEFVYTLAVAVFAYSSYYRRISLPVMLAGVAGLALLMSAVQIARNAQHRSVDAIVEAATESGSASVSAGLANVSGSGGVLLGAVTAVPDDHDYFMGELKVLEILGIIPYGRSLFLDETLERDYNNSSNFLTWYILGPNASYGVGTTIVADPYVDFGVPGVALAMFTLGFLANLLRDRAESSTSMTYAVLYCYFAALLVMLPRYSFLMIVRGLIWPMIFFWLIRKLLVGRQPRRVRVAGVAHERR